MILGTLVLSATLGLGTTLSNSSSGEQSQGSENESKKQEKEAAKERKEAERERKAAEREREEAKRKADREEVLLRERRILSEREGQGITELEEKMLYLGVKNSSSQPVTPGKFT